MRGNVIVVDDDAAVRKGCQRLFSAAGFDTQLFSCARDFELCGMTDVDRAPTCIVLDLQLGDDNGLSVQASLTKQGPPVVFVSAYADVSSSVAALKGGAFDFLEKPIDGEKLLDVVQSAIDADADALARLLAAQEVEARHARLTEREQEVLRQVLTGRLNKVIASELNITEKTVKVHRARVFEKMGVRSVAQLVRMCLLTGIRPAPYESEHAA